MKTLALQKLIFISLLLGNYNCRTLQKNQLKLTNSDIFRTTDKLTDEECNKIIILLKIKLREKYKKSRREFSLEKPKYPCDEQLAKWNDKKKLNLVFRDLKWALTRIDRTDIANRLESYLYKQLLYNVKNYINLYISRKR